MAEDRIPIVRIDERKIIVETSSGAQTGSIMAQLELLLGQFGYAKVNQKEIAYVVGAVELTEDSIIFPGDSRLSCKVSRRNYKQVKMLFDKNVEK